MEDWEIADLVSIIRDAVGTVDTGLHPEVERLRKWLADYDQDQIDLAFILSCCC